MEVNEFGLTSKSFFIYIDPIGSVLIHQVSGSTAMTIVNGQSLLSFGAKGLERLLLRLILY